MAKGFNIDITYLDFSKAFDLVDHSLLLRKMRKKGVRGKLLLWMRNFLLNRVQQVRVGQVLSRKAPLHSGVPQGSVMGPLLFLIFISDIDENLEDDSVKILKYVDDSKILSSVKKVEDIDRSQESLDKIYSWAEQNNMVWNQDKFQLLRVGKNINFSNF